MIFRRRFPQARRSPRHWLHTPVQVFTGSGHVEARGINLSDEGICIFSVSNLAVGAQIVVEFVSPSSKETIRARGKIRYRALYLYGVEFLPASHHEHHLPNELVRPENFRHSI